MANIDFLVYNTAISVVLGGGLGTYYRIVRYGICDSADLASQAYETNDVAIQNTAGEIPEYYNDGAFGYYPYINPLTNLLEQIQVVETPPYDPATDPTNHRVQSSADDTTPNVLAKYFEIYGSFGLGSTVNGTAIADLTAAIPRTGFYTASISTTVGVPRDTDPYGDGTLAIMAMALGTKVVFHAYQIAVPVQTWIGYRNGSTGAITWRKTTPSGNPFEYLWTTTGATAGLWLNTVGAGAGTFTSELPTLTSRYTMLKRSLYSSVATTANQVIGQRQTERTFFRGAAFPPTGGFHFNARFGFDTWTNGARLFAGLHTATTVISADPSALNNTCGFAVDAADNGLIYFQTRNTATTTRVSTGMTIVSGNGYEISVFCAPGAAAIEWRITDLLTGTTASGVQTLTLPATNVGNALGVLASNAALTAVNAVQLGVSRIHAKTEI